VTRSLLDVNVVLALIDPRHAFHDAAHRWSEAPSEWLLCPIVENGVLRVASSPRYASMLGATGAVREVLQALRGLPHVRFVPADVSLADDLLADPVALTSSRVTDLYLLGLAVRHAAQLVTFDRRIPAKALRGGVAALHVLEA
jgi:toxin-antitoxin system PIN domain toxin